MVGLGKGLVRGASAVLITLSVGGCISAAGGSEPSGAPDLTEASADIPDVIALTLSDFRFGGLPPKVRGGPMLLRATNAGPSEHQFEIIGVGERSVGVIGAMPSGGSGSLAITLEPGVYRVQCLITTAEGPSHADLGMTRTLQVG
jgi:hypothetical protein